MHLKTTNGVVKRKHLFEGKTKSNTITRKQNVELLYLTGVLQMKNALAFPIVWIVFSWQVLTAVCIYALVLNFVLQLRNMSRSSPCLGDNCKGKLEILYISEISCTRRFSPKREKWAANFISFLKAVKALVDSPHAVNYIYMY